MDKVLIRQRFSKALATYSKHAHIQDMMADRMLDMIAGAAPVCGNVIEAGCGTGTFTRKFLSRYSPESMLLVDICPEAEVYLDDLLSERVRFVSGDAENMEFGLKADLLVSCSVIQWFNNQDAYFDRVSRCLYPGGCFAFCTFGPQNMKELSVAGNAGLDYLPAAELRRMVSRNFTVADFHEEIVVLRFSSPLEVLKHLKNTGVTGIRKETWTKGRLESFNFRYRMHFSDGDSVILTYHPVYFVLKNKLL